MPRPTLAASPRAPWAWAAAGAVVGLLLALVLFVPASWLAHRVEAATDGRILLREPRGTLWTGSARVVLTGGRGSTDAAALPSRLTWRVRPAVAGLHVLLQTECCMPQPVGLDWRPGWGRATLAVADSRSLWPAGLLVGLGTPWNTLQLEGDLDLATKGLSLEWSAGRLAVAGSLEVVARRAASRLTTLRPMGSYRLVLSGGDVPNLQLTTLEGSLQLTGSGQWIGSRLRFNGEASAAPEREAALGNLLNIIGRRNGARSIITIG
ncbi:MAG TPA: type II secretion system protein N [Ramlibacter sp.]|nr:type II secretion system protein N [Ramlibacter sp.]